MKWLSLFLTLASNTHVKSALISLAGVLGSVLTQAATGADLGTVGSATAAGVSAWLANLLLKLAPLLVKWCGAKFARQMALQLARFSQLLLRRP